jgi:hypothetical protein
MGTGAGLLTACADEGPSTRVPETAVGTGAAELATEHAIARARAARSDDAAFIWISWLCVIRTLMELDFQEVQPSFCVMFGFLKLEIL